ncbi:hypothetical protein ACTFIR_008231 [Dictyostelium discoideum]
METNNQSSSTNTILLEENENNNNNQNNLNINLNTGSSSMKNSNSIHDILIENNSIAKDTIIVNSNILNSGERNNEGQLNLDSNNTNKSIDNTNNIKNLVEESDNNEKNNSKNSQDNINNNDNINDDSNNILSIGKEKTQQYNPLTRGSSYLLDNNSIASSSSNSFSPTGLVQVPFTPETVTIKRPIMFSTNLEQKQSFYNAETEDKNDSNNKNKKNDKNDSNNKTKNGTNIDDPSNFSPKLTSKIGRHTKKPSVFPCIIVVLFEIIFGLGTLYPLVIGIIRHHVTLLIYGCFGSLFLVFSIIGFISLLKIRPVLLKIFYYWKYFSLGLIILVTVAIGLLSYYKDPLVVSNWWASLILCVGIAILFIIWTVTCILWIKPLIKEIRSVESVVLKELVDEENIKDTSSDIDIDTLDKLTIKPQYGIIQPEEPLRIAMRKFNKNPETGIQFIQENNLLSQTPYRDIVTFLYNVDGLNKVKVGDYLGENNPININILQQFVDQYNFQSKNFDESLREFLSKFRLPGEAQKIDRIMESFARKYHRDNPGTFPDSDTAYLLAFSLILLNTDAHNPAIKNKMTKRSFVQNNTGFKGKKDLPIEYLESLYDRIINCELKMDSDSLFSNALIKGWLNKMTSNEKTWQRRWFVLKNNCLYYFKNEKDEDHPKVIIPLEGLKVTLLSDLIFEIEDTTVGTIKSVKLMPTGPVEGQHSKYLLKAPTIEEANKWVDSIRNNVLGSPVLQLIKKKKKILNRPSGGARRKSISNENSHHHHSRGSGGGGGGGGSSSNKYHASSSATSPINVQQPNPQKGSIDSPVVPIGRENDVDSSVNGSLKSDDYLTTATTSETDIYGGSQSSI